MLFYVTRYRAGKGLFAQHIVHDYLHSTQLLALHTTWLLAHHTTQLLAPHIVHNCLHAHTYLHCTAQLFAHHTTRLLAPHIVHTYLHSTQLLVLHSTRLCMHPLIKRHPLPSGLNAQVLLQLVYVVGGALFSNHACECKCDVKKGDGKVWYGRAS